jgi:hypothetical protein
MWAGTAVRTAGVASNGAVAMHHAAAAAGAASRFAMRATGSHGVGQVNARGVGGTRFVVKVTTTAPSSGGS